MQLKKKKIVHIFGGNPVGGVNTLLTDIIKYSNQERFEHVVIALSWKGRMEAKRLEQSGIKVTHMDFLFDEKDEVKNITQLANVIASEQPDVVQGWGRNGNYYSALAMQARKRINTGEDDVPLIWNLTSGRDQSQTPEPYFKKILSDTVKLSVIPHAIICASDKVKRAHIAMGCDPERLTVQDNGIDTALFTPDLTGEIKKAVRQEVGIPQDATVIGMAGRFDDNKDQKGFLLAAKTMHMQRPDVHFLLVGPDNDRNNKTLVSWIKEAGLEEVVHLLGARHDMPKIYHAADLWTSCSQSEAFGIAMLEAMASGKLCVATNTGIFFKAISGVGLVIPPRDFKNPLNEWDVHLTRAWTEMLNKPESEKQSARLAARNRVIENFNIRQTVKYYDELCQTLSVRQPAVAGLS